MNLIDNKHFVASNLRWNTGLLHKCLDVLNRVVTCCIKLKYVVTAPFGKGFTALAFIASLTLFGGILAVDSLSKDTCTSRLTHSSRSTKEIGMSQFATFYGILQRGSQCLLTNDRVEGHRSILTRRDDIFIHKSYFSNS